MKVRVLNKAHYTIEILDETGGLKKDIVKFEPYKEKTIEVSGSSVFFRNVRSHKELKINQFNPQAYLKRNDLILGKDFNFCYDSSAQHKGNAYIYAIEALSKPILEYLNNSEAGFLEKPAPGKDGKALNIRYFSSLRIAQQGKVSVGPHDIFYSHGIGDKNYWIGNHIQSFKYAFVPGPAWEERMRNTGYKGEIFQVGYTKLDPIFEIRSKLKNNIENANKINVLWLPTHGYCGKNKGRSSYPGFVKFLEYLDPTFNFIHSKHPTSKQNDKKKQLPTLDEYLNKNMVVIADGGSTIYEAWALGIPVVFPDWICKRDIINHFKKDKNNFEYMIYSKDIGYHARSIKEMNKMIETAVINGMKDEEKQFIEEIFPEELRGKSGKTAAQTLKNIKSTL